MGYVKRAAMRNLASVMVMFVAICVGSAARAEYLLGAGDVVKITVFQNNDLATEARVSEAGTVSFPLIGQVNATGASAAALERQIATRLRDGGFVNRPQVNALVIQFRSIQVSVLGQVNRPGRYPLEQSVNRVTDVIAIAGGLTPQGGDAVTVVRQEQGKEVRFLIDLQQALLESGGLAKDSIVRNGDVIYVPRYAVFYVYGEVQRPGQYRLERDMSVIQALASGGGFSPRGSQRGLRITRGGATPAGATTVSNLANGKEVVGREVSLSERIQPDDVLFVRESLF